MNYLQVKIVTKVLEQKIEYLKRCEYIKAFEKGESKEDITLLQDFIKEIQQTNLK